MSEAGAAIWVDVEDICAYFRFNPHPSGIQRVAIEITRALIGAAGDRVRIARHGAVPGQVREMRWADVETLMATPPALVRVAATAADDVERRSRVQLAILRLPAGLRDPLFRAGVLQSQVLRNLRILAGLVRKKPSLALRVVQEGATLTGGPRPGDGYLVLGAPWSVPGSAAHLAALRAAGVRTGLLIHDLIPVRRPEWQTPARVAGFRAWLEASLPASDVLFAISRFTAGDVGDYARRAGIGLGDPVQVLPAGSVVAPAMAERPVGLPVPGSYVLFVSTLEARKNHALAVKVWQKLMAEVRAGVRAGETVPQLVFAGRVGLGVGDLLQQMDNSRWLNGRIRLIRDPSDAEVRALYEGCSFTLLPSLYEGWGLPVGESLSLGKPCLAASGTALPEAGGDLCRYFDPEDVGAAHRAVAALLDEAGAVEAWQATVRAGFRTRSWQGAATAVLEAFAA